MKKKKGLMLLILCLLLLTASCGKEEESEDGFSVYFRDQSRCELVVVKASIDSGAETEEIISSVWSCMCDSSEGSGYVSAVPSGLSIRSYSLENNNLILNFDKSYPQVYSTDEVLLRAAVTKTFSQLDEVSSVEFYVDSRQLTDADGNILGPQKRADFVDVMEQGLNDYSFAAVTLYYANSSGDRLIPVKEEIPYKSDLPLAQHVVARLISGSEDSSAGQVLPADTKIISVVIRDSICYVNLNDAVERVEFTVSPELTVYAIVNSLTELSGISAVSISINGSSDLFLKTIDLSKPFTRNLDYVDTSEEIRK